jgi:putative hydrolase of the HAD superfamily
MRFADLDAVTVDGYGTLLHLVDPVPRLRDALAERGVKQTDEEIARAFRAEVAYYRPRAHEAHDAATLAALRRDCAGVFLADLGSPLEEPDTFVDAFMGSLAFEAVPGAVETLGMLRGHRLRLAVVANWDCDLPAHLERLGIAGLVDTVVTSARAGVPKPDPAIFELTLRELGVQPERALHVGDEPVDEDGARAAGLAFAPAPLSSAFADWS